MNNPWGWIRMLDNQIKFVYKPLDESMRDHPKYDLIKMICANEKIIDLRDRSQPCVDGISDNDCDK